ncbi:hypothetical protein GCM10009754_52830 [Amycolatopsis minnesotensis]|uniref:Uncharacterized protein n=1 Tax=Amycolatopsis minnesotensis TaxID=337894 RepID=A0ABP5D3B3_9PSEU
MWTGNRRIGPLPTDDAVNVVSSTDHALLRAVDTTLRYRSPSPPISLASNLGMRRHYRYRYAADLQV